jgi:hypothetical protein
MVIEEMFSTRSNSISPDAGVYREETTIRVFLFKERN